MKSLKLGLSLTGASSAFTPAALFTGANGFWFDPSDLSSMWQDSAGTTPAAVDSPVGKIDDKSGKSNHAIQATSTKRPILRQSGAVYWLEFDGVDDCLVISTLNLSAYGQAGFAVAQEQLATPVNGVIVEHSDNYNSNAAAFLIDSESGKLFAQVQSGSAYDGIATTTAVGGIGVTNVMSFQGLDVTQAAAASKFPMRFNGAAATLTTNNEALGALTTFGSYPLNIGARANGAAIANNWKMFGMVMRGGAFSSAELANTETWLGAKAGLTL